MVSLTFVLTINHWELGSIDEKKKNETLEKVMFLHRQRGRRSMGPYSFVRNSWIVLKLLAEGQ